MSNDNVAVCNLSNYKLEEEMDYFDFSKKSKIIIYGAGYIGKQHANALLSEGYNVVGFVDIRAKELRSVRVRVGSSEQEIPVVSRDDIQKISNSDEYLKDEIIIIAIRNIVEQEHLAKHLAEKGFKKLIYYKTETPEKERPFYDAFEHIQFSKMKKTKCSLYEDSLSLYKETQIIKEESDEVIVWLPVEMLFVDDDVIHIKNLHISMFKAYVDLFSLFENGLGNFEAYIDFFLQSSDYPAYRKEALKNDPLARQDFINNRFLLYEMYSKEFDGNSAFFIDNPCEVCWNVNGTFYLRDGVHRATFLYIKRMTQVPAKMSRSDYQKWLNQPILNKVIDIIDERNITSSYCSIPHPSLINFPSYRGRSSRRDLTIITFLNSNCKCDFGKMKILDVGCYHGHFTRLFARLGSDVTGIEVDVDKFTLACALNELFYLTGAKMFNGLVQDYNTEQVYDITLLLTVLYWTWGTPECLKILQRVDELTRWALVWESGDLIEEEKNFILKNSSFNSYHKICQTYGTGKLRELGVFFKNTEPT